MSIASLLDDISGRSSAESAMVNQAARGARDVEIRSESIVANLRANREAAQRSLEVAKQRNGAAHAKSSMCQARQTLSTVRVGASQPHTELQALASEGKAMDKHLEELKSAANKESKDVANIIRTIRTKKSERSALASKIEGEAHKLTEETSKLDADTAMTPSC
jgi:chromosome segregation ATPase